MIGFGLGLPGDTNGDDLASYNHCGVGANFTTNGEEEDLTSCERGVNLSQPLTILAGLAVEPASTDRAAASSAVDRPLISYNAGVCSVWRSPGPTSDRRRPLRGTKSTEALRDRFALGPWCSIFRRCGLGHSPVPSSPTQAHG